jgi:probable phosphoglycerate mutase
MSEAPIYFVRHGETDHNAQGRIQGRIDIPLNGRGRDQARAVGKALSRHLAADGYAPADLPFCSSPLSRASETARLARAAMGLEPEAFAREPRLMEIHFGDWEGLTWPQIRAQHGPSARRRDEDFWNVAPPGGESYVDVAARLEPLLAELSGPSVLVAHSGVARALLVLIGGYPIASARDAYITQGRVLRFARGSADWL